MQVFKMIRQVAIYVRHRAPRGGVVRKWLELESWGQPPQSVQASLNGPCLIRHRRIILKNPEQDKPFRRQAFPATPDLRGSYEPLWTGQIEQPLFFSLADNWIPGYAWPTNGRLTFRVSTIASITEGPAYIYCHELTYLNKVAGT